MLLAIIIFWFCVYCILHSYVLYPLILKIVASNKANNQLCYDRGEELPSVSFIMSLYNEESVIEEKLKTVLASDYPIDKLHIYVGSDCSSDKTNNLVQKLADQHPHLHFFPFQERRGKPSVVNDLVAKAKSAVYDPNHILIVSDANVFLEPFTIFNLIRHFKNQAIGLVDSNIQNPKTAELTASGIDASEKNYISREVYIKNMEGRAWGRAMGPLGGCYAFRAKYFEPIPSNLLVDDFYVAMKVFEQGGLAINDLEAVCYESVPSNIEEEFRRKKRISAGNFANLMTFRHLLWPLTSSMSFAFLSHKVLRWLGPFFILISYLCLAILAFVFDNQFYKVLFVLQSFGLFGIPVLDWLFKKINLNVVLLRYITYFNAMNLALFSGFFKYLKGIQNGIWQPTKRDS